MADLIMLPGLQLMMAANNLYPGGHRAFNKYLPLKTFSCYADLQHWITTDIIQLYRGNKSLLSDLYKVIWNNYKNKSKITDFISIHPI